MRLTVPALAASLFLLLTGCAKSPCEAMESCQSCAFIHVEEGCYWCPTDGTCNDSLDDSACGFSSQVTSSSQCIETGGGSSTGSCTSTYQGPTDDPQVATQCMSVWNYRCKMGDASKADQNCLVYDSLEATVSCPYCPGGGGGGSTPSEPTIPANTCNTSGVSQGCSSSYPFSCNASNTCYTTLAGCANDSACRR